MDRKIAFMTLFIVLVLIFSLVFAERVIVTTINADVLQSSSSFDISLSPELVENFDELSGGDNLFKVKISTGVEKYKVNIKLDNLELVEDFVGSEYQVTLTPEVKSLVEAKEEKSFTVKVIMVKGSGQTLTKTKSINIISEECPVGTEIEDQVVEPGDVESPPKCVPVSGKSVVYYMKLINKKIVENELNQSKEIIAGANKEKPSTNKDVVDGPAEGTSSKDNSFVWQNVKGSSSGYVLDFPKTEFGSSTGTLSIFFYTNPVVGGWLAKYVQVSNNGKKVNCNSDDAWLTGIVDSYSGTLIYVFGKKERTCEADFANRNIAIVTVEGTGGGYYDVTIESPLVPNSCNGKSQSNDDSSNRSLFVIC